MTKRILNEKGYWNMSYIITGDPINKNQPVSPLIIGTVGNLGNYGQLVGVGRDFWAWIFGGQVQRRGTHVNTPKIGSRVGVFCFGGIYRFYAEL
jgi:hypothetical protein